MGREDCIDFVVLTWNSAGVIEACLNSVLALGCLHRLYVVDNGSADGTLAKIKAIAGTHPAGNKLCLIPCEKNLGTTVSRNLALRKISPDIPYVCILDSDTQVNPEAFKLMMDTLDDHPDCLLTGPRLISPDGTPQLAARSYPTPWDKLLRALPMKQAQEQAERIENAAAPQGEEPYPADYLMSACWLMKRSTLELVGLLDERIFFAPEDVEYCTRIRRAGYQVLHCPKAHILHHWQRISKKKLISYHNAQHVLGLLYLWKKYGFSGK